MKGGAGILMSKANKSKNTKTYFIDTFEGFAKSYGEHKRNFCITILVNLRSI